MKRLTLLLITGLFSQQLWAVDNTCLDSAATQKAMNYCADSIRLQATRVLKNLMAELNLRNELSDTQKDQLSQIHQVWYESADLDCKWLANDHKGSTRYPYVMHNCWSERILLRIEWLAPKLCQKGQTRCMANKDYFSALPY